MCVCVLNHVQSFRHKHTNKHLYTYIQIYLSKLKNHVKKYNYSAVYKKYAEKTLVEDRCYHPVSHIKRHIKPPIFIKSIKQET